MEKIISGKVREVYSVDDSHLVIVTTDRISAFDVILDSEIPGKGAALNLLSNFWFSFTKDIIPNHLLSVSLSEMPDAFRARADYYQDRTVLVKKLQMIPFEFIVRGYMFGSMWEAYRNGEAFCGHHFAGDYQQAGEIQWLYPGGQSKSNTGHDTYISIDQVSKEIGPALTRQICEISLQLYDRCSTYAKSRGILIADTKFEFGFDDEGSLTLGDEIFTPDSSRFWDEAHYQVGVSPKSYDKQFVRDWLIKEGLAGKEPAPTLPREVIDITSQKYKDCLSILTR